MVRKLQVLMIVCILVEAIAVTVIAVLFYVPTCNLKTQLSLGDKYLSEMDYEKAILAYKTAVEIDDKCEAAYTGLTGAYIGIGDYNAAYYVVESAKSNGIWTSNIRDVRDLIEDMVLSKEAEVLSDKSDEKKSLATIETEDDNIKETNDIPEEIGTGIFNDDDTSNNDEKIVDIRDYIDEWTIEFGGNLENILAGKLSSSAVCIDEETPVYSLCGGSIEISGVTNATGYVLTLLDEVDGFSVFRIKPGIKVSDAISALRNQGMLRHNNGYSDYYSVNPDVYYVEFTEENGLVSKVIYTRCTPAKTTADYE